MKNIDKKWLDLVQASSIPLRCLDSNSLPVGLASGCMIDYCGKRILLSVFHATSKPGRWSIELRYDAENKRTELYYPRAFNFLAEMRLGVPKINHIDFSYTQIPANIESIFQQLTPKGDYLAQRKRPVFSPTFQVRPSKEEIYAFSGQIKPKFVDAINTLITEHQTYPALRYDRTVGAYHFFKLPVKHPGHEAFQGCSGAPILDTKNNVVALVCGGDISADEIYGIDLGRYKVALDVTYSMILK